MGLTKQGAINGSRIIRTECGERTGETIYVTANGSRWTTELDRMDTTGVTRRTIEPPKR